MVYLTDEEKRIKEEYLGVRKNYNRRFRKYLCNVLRDKLKTMNCYAETYAPTFLVFGVLYWIAIENLIVSIFVSAVWTFALVKFTVYSNYLLEKRKKQLLARKCAKDMQARACKTSATKPANIVVKKAA